jgi:hypothetical protein
MNDDIGPPVAQRTSGPLVLAKLQAALAAGRIQGLFYVWNIPARFGSSDDVPDPGTKRF